MTPAGEESPPPECEAGGRQSQASVRAAHSEIGGILIERGRALIAAPRREVQFTSNKAANQLLNDLESHPHAFVLGCAMDRQMRAGSAWLIPYHFALALGTFSMTALSELSLSRVTEIMTRPKPLHRFGTGMAVVFHAALRRIIAVYDGDATRIWSGRPTSAEAVSRFLAFHGVGPKIATMAINLLAREFKVPFADYYSVDVSADVHVRRVFARLGLCDPDASVAEVVYRARAINPEFPGLLDSPCWEIGRRWCRPQRPLCTVCHMRRVCPTAADKVGS